MKKCLQCGRVNNDESKFCAGCGSQEFTPIEPEPTPPPPPPPHKNIWTKAVLTLHDVFSIFGFAASLIGLFGAGLVLEPLAIAASILSFKKTKYKGMTAAAIVISIIAFVIKLLRMLYEAGVIPHWVISGAFG